MAMQPSHYGHKRPSGKYIMWVLWTFFSTRYWRLLVWVSMAECPASQSTHQRDGKPVRSPQTWAVERQVRRLAGGPRFSK